MNKVILMGRLTKDPTYRLSRSVNPTPIAQYTLAVDRKYKVQGQSETDFIICKALGKNADFVEKYLKKGMKIAIVGRLQVHISDNNGTRRYYTEVIVEEHNFAESKSSYQSINNNQANNELNGGSQTGDGFVPVNEDDDLPF